MHTAGHSVRLVGHSSTVRPFPDSAVNRPEPAFHETEDTVRGPRQLRTVGHKEDGGPALPGAIAKLPPVDVLRGQVLGTIVAPLTGILALFTAPLQDLYGLIDARIEQLQEQGDTSAEEASGSEPQAEESGSEPHAEESGSEPQAEAGSETETATETETETTEEEQ